MFWKNYQMLSKQKTVDYERGKGHHYEEKSYFHFGDKAKLKSLQKELRDGIRKCRVKYREKLEANLSNNN